MSLSVEYLCLAFLIYILISRYFEGFPVFRFISLGGGVYFLVKFWKRGDLWEPPSKIRHRFDHKKTLSGLGRVYQVYQLRVGYETIALASSLAIILIMASIN